MIILKKYLKYVSLIIVSILTLIIIYSMLIFNSEYMQIQLLKNIYKDLLIEQLHLDQSSYTNFITNKEYINKKELLNYFENENSNIVLKLKYIKKSNVLIVYLNNHSNNTTTIQKYKIKLGIFKLDYIKLEEKQEINYII